MTDSLIRHPTGVANQELGRANFDGVATLAFDLGDIPGRPEPGGDLNHFKVMKSNQTQQTTNDLNQHSARHSGGAGAIWQWTMDPIKFLIGSIGMPRKEILAR